MERYVNAQLVDLIIRLSCYSPNGRVFHPIQKFITDTTGPISPNVGSDWHPAWAEMTIIRPDEQSVIEVAGQTFTKGIVLRVGQGKASKRISAEVRKTFPLTERSCFLTVGDAMIESLIEGVAVVTKDGAVNPV